MKNGNSKDHIATRKAFIKLTGLKKQKKQTTLNTAACSKYGTIGQSTVGYKFF